MRALKLEQERKFEESLKLIFLIVHAMKTINKAAATGDIANAQIKRAEVLKKDKEQIEESKEALVLNSYSDKLKKEVLERAVFLAISMGDFK